MASATKSLGAIIRICQHVCLDAQKTKGRIDLSGDNKLILSFMQGKSYTELL